MKKLEIENINTYLSDNHTFITKERKILAPYVIIEMTDTDGNYYNIHGMMGGQDYPETENKDVFEKLLNKRKRDKCFACFDDDSNPQLASIYFNEENAIEQGYNRDENLFEVYDKMINFNFKQVSSQHFVEYVKNSNNGWFNVEIEYLNNDLVAKNYDTMSWNSSDLGSQSTIKVKALKDVSTKNYQNNNYSISKNGYWVTKI